MIPRVIQKDNAQSAIAQTVRCKLSAFYLLLLQRITAFGKSTNGFDRMYQTDVRIFQVGKRTFPLLL